MASFSVLLVLHLLHDFEVVSERVEDGGHGPHFVAALQENGKNDIESATPQCKGLL